MSSVASRCRVDHKRLRLYLLHDLLHVPTRRTQTAFAFPCTLLLTSSSRFNLYNRVFVFLPDGMAESVPRSDS